MIFNAKLFDSVMFCDTFCRRNSLICQENTPWNVDEIVSKSKIVFRKAAENNGRKL